MRGCTDVGFSVLLLYLTAKWPAALFFFFTIFVVHPVENLSAINRPFSGLMLPTAGAFLTDNPMIRRHIVVIPVAVLQEQSAVFRTSAQLLCLQGKRVKKGYRT